MPSDARAHVSPRSSCRAAAWAAALGLAACALPLSTGACAADASSPEPVHVRVAPSGTRLLALRLADATCATSRPDPDGALAAMADAIVARTNAARAELGLPALSRSSCLDEIAWKHSAALAALGEPGSPTPGWPHVLDGVGPGDRVVAAGFAPAQVRENVFDHWDSANGEPRFDDAALPERATTWWLESPPHRASLLASDVTMMGVGVVRIVRGDRGEYWATQLFSADPAP